MAQALRGFREASLSSSPGQALAGLGFPESSSPVTCLCHQWGLLGSKPPGCFPGNPTDSEKGPRAAPGHKR